MLTLNSIVFEAVGHHRVIHLEYVATELANQLDCWPRWAVRDGDWKLLNDGNNRVELYNVSDDWSETRNVAREHPEIVTKLSAKLELWKASLPKEVPQAFISKDRRGR